MENRHVLLLTQWNYRHVLPCIKWDYSIIQFMDLQASITTHQMEYRHVLLPTQWNYRAVYTTHQMELQSHKIDGITGMY